RPLGLVRLADHAVDDHLVALRRGRGVDGHRSAGHGPAEVDAGAAPFAERHRYLPTFPTASTPASSTTKKGRGPAIGLASLPGLSKLPRLTLTWCSMETVAWASAAAPRSGYVLVMACIMTAAPE